MKRRDFVKGLAAVPLAAIASQIARPTSDGRASSARRVAIDCKQGAWRLNVVVHGMFVIVVDKKAGKVLLRAPKVGGQTPHRYCAKSFTVDGAGKPTEIWNYDPVEGTVDTPQFSTCGGAKFGISTGEKNRLAIDVSRNADGNTPFWTIKLPMPDDICGLRATPFNYFAPCSIGDCEDPVNDPPSLTYKFNGMSWDQHCPLVYLLTYQIPANERIVLSANKEVKFDSGIGRLHVFAEPDTAPTAASMAHVNDAINELNNLFKKPLTLRLWPAVHPESPDLDVGRDDIINCKSDYAMKICEESSLYELKQSCSDFLQKDTIDVQYSKYMQLLLDAKAKITSRQSLTKHGHASLHSKRALTSRDFLMDVRQALPNGAKPPRNCMSLICIRA